MRYNQPMLLDDDSCYAALQAHDTRFDGRFFVGVSSTGVYCRPVCRVRLPRRENCSFYPSAAAAEGAGFRPCLRCRPEQAPGHSPVEAASRLAHAAASRIQEELLENGRLEGLAERLGVTSRHLRRAFRAEFGVSPVAFAQTQRLLLARRLLRDTALDVTSVAMASGFGSVRRFNALFQERYRVRPSELRREAGAPPVEEGLRFELGYRPPYAWEAMLDFLAERALPGVEWVEDGSYRRTVLLDVGGRRCAGWLEATPVPRRSVLGVTLSCGLAPAVPRVLQRVRRLFDLDARPDEVEHHLGELVRTPGLRVPGCFDGFEMAVRAVLGQRISVKGARTHAGRLVAACGTEVATPHPRLTHAFPRPTELMPPCGLTGAQRNALAAVAAACVDGRLSLAPTTDVPAEMDVLRGLPGIGEWTVQVIAMRALAWPDAFPHTDLGVRHALPGLTDTQILERARAWSPWRAYAAAHLWRSLKTTEETR